MRLSRRGLYALKALLALAGHPPEDVVKIQAISRKEGIPQKFLESILVVLKNARLVESTRGAMGGYRLKRPADQIHLGEIVRIIDGPLAPLGDAAELRRLAGEDPTHPGLFSILLDVRDAAARILDSTSLADVLKRTRELSRVREKDGGRQPR
jgi:Rrf2 family protein